MWLILLLVDNCQHESHHKIGKRKLQCTILFVHTSEMNIKFCHLLVIIISGDFKSVHVLKQYAPWGQQHNKIFIFVFPTVNMINIAFIKVQQQDIFQNLITCDDYWVCLKKKVTHYLWVQLNCRWAPSSFCQTISVYVCCWNCNGVFGVCALFVTNTSVRLGMCFWAANSSCSTVDTEVCHFVRIL
jgi:hypothetical protein